MIQEADRIHLGESGKPAGKGAWFWVAVIVLAYVASYGSLIARHTALPMHDEAGYVGKAFYFSEALKENPRRFLHPSFYFDAPPPIRPPLLPLVAALIQGTSPTIMGTAFTNLFIRLAVIVLSLFLLSRLVERDGFIPAALLVILTPALNWSIGDHLLSDASVGAFCLLAVVLVLRDDSRQSLSNSCLAAAALFALFLIKQSAPIILLPFCLVRALRALIFVFRPDSAFCTRPASLSGRGTDSSTKWQRVLSLFPWAIPYLALPALYALTYYNTSYGDATRATLVASAAGYWAFSLKWTQLFALLASIMPPWLLILFIICAWRRRGGWDVKLPVYAFAGATGLALTYLVFFTDTYQTRYMYAVLPASAALMLAYFWRNGFLPRVATIVAAALFLTSLCFATGRIDRYFLAQNTPLFISTPAIAWQSSSDQIVFLPNPDMPSAQFPRPDNGFLSFVENLARRLPDHQVTPVLLVPQECGLDGGTALFTEHLLDKNLRGRIGWRSLFGQDQFKPGEALGYEWYVVAQNHYSIGSPSCLPFNAIGELLRNPDSPIAECFTRRMITVVKRVDPHIIENGKWQDQELYLYQKTSAVTLERLLAALHWLKGRLPALPNLQSIVDRQIELLDPLRSLMGICGLAIHNDNIPAYCQPQLLPGITLGGGRRDALMLHALPDGKDNELRFKGITIPEKTTLSFGVGLHPGVWHANMGDGVRFRVEIVADGKRAILFDETVDPGKSEPNWRDHTLSLAEYGGQTVDIVLSTRAGEANNNNYDNALWSGLNFAYGK